MIHLGNSAPARPKRTALHSLFSCACVLGVTVNLILCLLLFPFDRLRTRFELLATTLVLVTCLIFALVGYLGTQIRSNDKRVTWLIAALGVCICIETGAGSSLTAATVMDRVDWVWSCRVANPTLRALDCERRSLLLQAAIPTTLLLLPIVSAFLLLSLFNAHRSALDPPPAEFRFESLHPDEAVPPGWNDGPSELADDSSESETEDDEERVGLIRGMRRVRAEGDMKEVGSSEGGRKKRVYGRSPTVANNDCHVFQFDCLSSFSAQPFEAPLSVSDSHQNVHGLYSPSSSLTTFDSDSFNNDLNSTFGDSLDSSSWIAAALAATFDGAADAVADQPQAQPSPPSTVFDPSAGPVYSPPPATSPALVDGAILGFDVNDPTSLDKAFEALVSSTSSSSSFSPSILGSGTLSVDATPFLRDDSTWDGTLDPVLFGGSTLLAPLRDVPLPALEPTLFPVSAFPSSSFTPAVKAAAPSRVPFTRESSTTSSTSYSSKPAKPTGFRTDIAPLPADAPIQKRQYLLPSSTSRKRNPSILTRELEKRVRLNEPYAPTDLLQSDAVPNPVGLSAELETVVEKKRRQNTLAARRSRERKVGRVKELEEESERLRTANAQLEERLSRMEKVLESVGLMGMV